MRMPRLLLAASSIASALLLSLGCGSSGGGGTPTTPGGGGLTLGLTFPAQGTSRQHIFTSAGTFDYRCSPHGGSGMTGRVTVDAGSTNDSAVVNVGQSNNLVFNPANVTIKVGGSVRWVNVSTFTNHTVTYP